MAWMELTPLGMQPLRRPSRPVSEIQKGTEAAGAWGHDVEWRGEALSSQGTQSSWRDIESDAGRAPG